MEHGHAIQPIDGEVVSGDRVAVLPVGDGVLFGVIDGLGHGPQAAEAARCTEDFLREHAGDPLSMLLQGCDRALARTRGVALTLLRITLASGVLQHVAVGNVEVSSATREPVHPISRPGVVGRGFRKAVVSSYRLHAGDLIAVHTDGVSSRFSLRELRGSPPTAIAHQIVDRYRRPHDDAACLVIAL